MIGCSFQLTDGVARREHGGEFHVSNFNTLPIPYFAANNKKQ